MIDGKYLPGPEGTTSGDYWVGDTVRLHTGTTEFDFNENNAVVRAITIAREDGNAELLITNELEDMEPNLACADGACAAIDLEVVQLVPFRVLASGTPGEGLVNGAYEVLATADPGGPVFGRGMFTVTLPVAPDPKNMILLLLCASSPEGAGAHGEVTGMTSLGHVNFVGNGGAGGSIGGHFGCADGATITVRQVGHNFNFGALLCQVIELAGVRTLQSATLQSSEVATTTPGVSVTPTAGSKVAILTKMLINSWTHDGSASGMYFTPKTGVTELSESDFAGANPRVYGNPGQWVGYVLDPDASGSYDVNPTLAGSAGAASWCSMTCIFECDA